MRLHTSNPSDGNIERRCIVNIKVPGHRRTRTVKCGIKSQQSPRLCGQSRTTIRACHFASLIGRLWIGGH